MHVVLLIACAAAIYLSCEWFVNAVERLGQRLNVGSMAAGTILAAFGTALPESLVTRSHLPSARAHVPPQLHTEHESAGRSSSAAGVLAVYAGAAV